MQPAPPPPPPPIVYVYPAPPPPRSNLALWIVLGVLGGIFVIGILAAIAIPSFMGYQKKAKRGEADLHLKVLEKGIKTWFIENAAFPEGDTGLTPARPCCEHGRSDRKCEVEPSQWLAPVWDQTWFMMDEPHFFQYSYRGTTTEMTATAVGDLDCDGITMTYTLEGRVVDGAPVFTLTKPTTME